MPWWLLFGCLIVGCSPFPRAVSALAYYRANNAAAILRFSFQENSFLRRETYFLFQENLFSRQEN
jgi:hypothetical protein